MRTFLRITAFAVILSLPILYSSCGDGGGGTGPDPEPAETLASFQLTVPDSIAEGEAFSLIVKAVGSRGSTPLTSYSGTVSLSTTLGSVNPASLTVSNGTGATQVTLSVPGQQTLTASGGGRTGSVAVGVTDLPDPPIPGDPAATLEQAVPDSVYLPDPNDYSNDHPDLTGMYLSHNVVLMAFSVGTTVQQANDLLGPLGGQLVGGISGVQGNVPSILIVKLATTGHAEMEATLTALRANPAVLHVVQDALLSTDAVPRYTGWTSPGWIWEWVQPAGGNWGMELIRVPQMWNLNRALEKTNPTVWTGVIDVGFDVGHVDLKNRPQVSFNPGVVADHGTHVAGIIGADFFDGQGIEGVNPFAGFVFSSPAFSGPPDALGLRRSWGEIFTNTLLLVADASNEVGVINMSLGYKWYLANIDTNTSLPAQDLARNQGAIFKYALDGLATTRPLPMIAVAAGNGSGSGMGQQAARYASPMCNAALDHGAANIIVVENVRHDPGGLGDAEREVSSNVGGHLSAPGTDILSTIPLNGYVLKTGTSMASPHVAGLIGYMMAVDPTLTIPQIRTALFDTAVPVGGFASNRIDAWAAVMQIDQVQGDDRVLKRMLDIDDGTVDGNQRVDYDTLTFPDLDSLDVDEDGGLGDGNVDMSDFRVWRDWYLKIWESGIAEFDGRDDHPKLDVNDNGTTEDDAGESLYPRGDFNGDGILSLEDSVWVLGAVQDSLSDLDVFKLVFDDPDIDKDALDTLVLSSDVTVDASIAFDIYTSPPIKAEMWRGGQGLNGFAQEFELTAAEPRKTFTVRSRPGGYFLEVRIGSASRFVDNTYRALATRPGTDAVVWPIKPVPIDAKSTFLNSCDDPDATTAPAIPLESLRVEPGDFLFLDGAGALPEVNETVAVFSASDEIKVETEQIPVGGGEPPLILTKRTVTDAIAIGDDLLGGRTYQSPPTRQCGGIFTDIPHDFTPFQVSFVRVPDGATHLFLGNGSEYYSDNEASDLRVHVSKWYAPEWHDMHAPVSPVRKER